MICFPKDSACWLCVAYDTGTGGVASCFAGGVVDTTEICVDLQDGALAQCCMSVFVIL